MISSSPIDIPADVIQWVSQVFSECNRRITSKLTNNPNVPEESLDDTWIEHFSHLSTPLTLSSAWTVKIETHYIGALRHFNGWEVADIGILLFVRRGGRVERSKVALLQSKRLYPKQNQIRETLLTDYRTGFASLADPEDLRTSIATQNEFEFNDGCRFAAIKANSDQITNIINYQRQNNLSVYYQLYSPWSLPIIQRVPLSGIQQYGGMPTAGVRIVPSSVIHDYLSSQEDGYKPRFNEIQMSGNSSFLYGWPLEFFASELFLKCHEGNVFETIGDSRIQNLFYRRSGAISAAIAITIEDPEG